MKALEDSLISSPLPENSEQDREPVNPEDVEKLLKSLDPENAHQHLIDLLNTPFKTYMYLKRTQKTRISPKQSLPKVDALPNLDIFKINFPVRIAKVAPQDPGKDIVKYTINGPTNCVEEFCNNLNHFCRPLDVITAAYRLKKIDFKEKERLVKSLDHRIFDNPSRIFSFVSNGLSNGRLIKDESIHSYTKKKYPIGPPSCKGSDSLAQDLLNLYYVAVEQRTSAKSGKPHIIQQVSNDLEAVEDFHAAMDVEIARNESVRRHLIEYQDDYIWTAPDTSDEMLTCCGKGGCVMLKLIDYHPDHVNQRIDEILHRRLVNLSVSRIISKPRWSRTLELYFPTSRAHFQKTPKHINDYTIYKDVRTPLPFSKENVSFITLIFDKFFSEKIVDPKPPPPEELSKWREAITKMIQLLRMPDEIPFVLNYSQAVLFSSLCILTNKLDVVRAMMDNQAVGRKIPLEIGITDDTMAGAERVFEIAVQTIINKKKKLKDGLLEIAGLFRRVDITFIAEIIKTMLLAIKAMKHYASPTQDKEGALVTATINGDRVDMALINNKVGEPVICIDLEQYKPKEGFR